MLWLTNQKSPLSVVCTWVYMLISATDVRLKSEIKAKLILMAQFEQKAHTQFAEKKVSLNRISEREKRLRKKWSQCLYDDAGDRYCDVSWGLNRNYHFTYSFTMNVIVMRLKTYSFLLNFLLSKATPSSVLLRMTGEDAKKRWFSAVDGSESWSKWIAFGGKDTVVASIDLLFSMGSGFFFCSVWILSEFVMTKERRTKRSMQQVESDFKIYHRYTCQLSHNIQISNTQNQMKNRRFVIDAV